MAKKPDVASDTILLVGGAIWVATLIGYWLYTMMFIAKVSWGEAS